MPTILETIQEYETDILEMIAEQWGFDIDFISRAISADEVAIKMQKEDASAELFETLSKSETEALSALAKNQGKIKWDSFSRKYGQIREMGAIPRKRERPDRNPKSIAEHLFYMGIIGRAFFKDKTGLEEYAYLPDEWIDAFSFPDLQNEKQVGLRFCSGKSIRVRKWSNGIIQHAATMLAEFRKSIDLPQRFLNNPETPVSFLRALLIEGKMIGENDQLDTERTKKYLKLSQPQALIFLFQIWRDSVKINELSLMDNLEIEGGWKNNPSQLRESLFPILLSLPAQKWVYLKDFISWIYDNQPDLLRAAGEYDSWLIKNPASGEFLRGFENWHSVEGAFLQYWITGPAVWMGLVEIGTNYKEPKNVFFRVSSQAKSLLDGKLPNYDAAVSNILYVDKSGKIEIPRSFPLDIRYKIARFCDLILADAKKYIYRITPESLFRLKKQALKPSQLVSLLQKYGRKPVPANIITAIHRWQEHKLEAEIHEACLLEVHSKEIIEKINKTPAAAYILAQINETTIKITKQGIPYIQSALLDFGIFSNTDSDL